MSITPTRKSGLFASAQSRGVLFLVVVVDVDAGLIRIISARFATRREVFLYGQYLQERSDA
jgi:uncharacterized DUF497 family protein